MKINKIVSILIIIIIVISMNVAPLRCSAVNNYQSVIDGISALNDNFSQDYIDNILPEKNGASSEWYVIALSRFTNLDFSQYILNRTQYLNNNFPQNACERQRYSLAIMAAGYENQFVRDTSFDSIGQQGIMSYIFGLHMLNNGCDGSYTADEVVDILLSMQLSDGGFAITGEISDVDVTAMTLQALAPYTYNPDVYSAVQTALDLLSERQLANGGYQSYGVENPESSAQVITALSCLGIDPFGDERFIKDGTILDAICLFRLPDGSFSHTVEGDYNAYTTVQVFYSMVAAEMYYRGENYYIFNRQKTEYTTQSPETTPIQTQSPANAATENQYSQYLNDSQVSSVLQNNIITSSLKTVSSSSGLSETCFSDFTQVSNSTTDSTTETSANISETSFSETVYSDTLSYSEISPQDTTSIETMSATELSDNHINPKIIIYICILSIGTVACIVLVKTCRKNIKNFIFTVAAVTVACAAVTAVNIQSPEEYYNSTENNTDNRESVIITIRCDTISNEIGESCILDNYTVSISDGDTVYDVLVEATKANKIQLDGDSGYIKGINYLYEFDYGDLSGWIYHINGTEATVGCGDYEVSDGDFIEWLYTCDLGHDLKQGAE